MIKVVQTVHAKFHHFDLARQLHRHGMLSAIFTGYPRWKLRDEKIPDEKIKTFPWIRTFLMAKWRFGFHNETLDRQLNWWAARSLDAYVAANLTECDVLVALSGGGLRSGRQVKKQGGKYICDRGSTHIRFSDQILTEEFKRFGQVFPGVDPRALAREEEEYAEANVITVPSDFCVRSFVEMGIHPSKVKKIPYGVDLHRFKKTGDAPDDRFEALFVGQVSFRKGIPYLLEAFAKLKHPKKRLRLAGAILPEMQEYLRETRLANVEFLGPIPQEDLVPLMSSSHVMVLPSVEDGLGLVLGQAMACGCPIICSTNTGGEELLGKDLRQFVLPIRDAEAIRNLMEMLWDDRALHQKTSEAVLRRVQAISGWDQYGSAYASLCGQLSQADTGPAHQILN